MYMCSSQRVKKDFVFNFLMWAYIEVYFCGFMHLSLVLQRSQDNVLSPEGTGTVLVVDSMCVL